MCVLFMLRYLSVGMAIALVFTKSRCSHFCLRLKNNEFVEYQKDIWVELQELGLAPGVFFLIFSSILCNQAINCFVTGRCGPIR